MKFILLMMLVILTTAKVIKEQKGPDHCAAPNWKEKAAFLKKFPSKRARKVLIKEMT